MASGFVFPGDYVAVPSTSAVKLGPGLAVVPDSEEGNAKDRHELIVTLPGVLGQVQSAKTRGKARDASLHASSAGGQTSLWVETNSARYTPSAHDHVLCQITARGAEAYQVSLLSSHTPANLPALLFEGATKRNKPNLRVGTLLYAQVVSASRHAEVELTCVDPATGKSGGFGELKTERTSDPTAAASSGASARQAEASAMLWSVSCGLARSLLLPSHQLLGRVAAHFPFEVAIGVNGFVWARGHNARHVLALGKVLEEADKRAWTEAEQVAGDAATEIFQLDAMKMAKERGSLSNNDIARIIEPFKKDI